MIRLAPRWWNTTVFKRRVNEHECKQHLHRWFCGSVGTGITSNYFRTHRENPLSSIWLCSSQKAKTRVARNTFVQLPAANSSIVISGKRIRESALPRTFRLFSGITWSCCRWHSASDQRTTALNKRTSRIPRVSLSSTATRVSARQDRQRQLQALSQITPFYLATTTLCTTKVSRREATEKPASPRSAACSLWGRFICIFHKQVTHWSSKQCSFNWRINGSAVEWTATYLTSNLDEASSMKARRLPVPYLHSPSH